MKAQELRIGNWYNEFGIPKQTTAEFILRLSEIESKGKIAIDVSPIPLTEGLFSHLLVKHKEWKGNGADYQPETSKTVQVRYSLTEDIYILFECFSWRTSEDDEWINEHSIYIDMDYTKIHLSQYYFHTFQNLFFALTGTELEITPVTQE